MTTDVRYQVFVSSTYDDLREERQQATQAILDTGWFPSGMELFPASDNSQWELIKRVISECDYYLLILGGRYGSIGPEGKSYTEMEYDYAVSQGIPILGFVRGNPDEIPGKFLENTEEGKEKLQAFRDKVMARHCRKYNDASELGRHVMQSLIQEARLNPRVGWIRADRARLNEDIQRENRLVDDLADANDTIRKLEREIRDKTILDDEIPRDKLAQGEDLFEFSVSFQSKDNEFVSESVKVSWNEIFRTIGPSMYGFILRKHGHYNEVPCYSFRRDIEAMLRTRISEKVGRRKMYLLEPQVDTCVFQFKELGLLEYVEQTADDGGTYRGITLTQHGERQLTILKTQLR